MRQHVEQMTVYPGRFDGVMALNVTGTGITKLFSAGNPGGIGAKGVITWDDLEIDAGTLLNKMLNADADVWVELHPEPDQFGLSRQTDFFSSER